MRQRLEEKNLALNPTKCGFCIDVDKGSLWGFYNQNMALVQQKRGFVLCSRRFNVLRLLKLPSDGRL